MSVNQNVSLSFFFYFLRFEVAQYSKAPSEHLGLEKIYCEKVWNQDSKEKHGNDDTKKNKGDNDSLSLKFWLNTIQNLKLVKGHDVEILMPLTVPKPMVSDLSLTDFIFLGSRIIVDSVVMKLKDACSLEGKL